MSTSEESKTVARSFYEAYNGGDLQGAFDTYISRDLINHTNGGAMNREVWMQSDLAARVAMPDQTMTILGQAADGDTVFTH
ncbi:MAG TPA: nuclear transport factor 2 family protein, partial [Nocardioides sp.]|nr:nuclear transport factor 2 family protein [Nocardioides sp.]